MLHDPLLESNNKWLKLFITIQTQCIQRWSFNMLKESWTFHPKVMMFPFCLCGLLTFILLNFNLDVCECQVANSMVILLVVICLPKNEADADSWYFFLSFGLVIFFFNSWYSCCVPFFKWTHLPYEKLLVLSLRW